MYCFSLITSTSRTNLCCKWKKHFLSNEDKSSPLRWVRWSDIDKLCKEYRDKALKKSNVL